MSSLRCCRSYGFARQAFITQCSYGFARQAFIANVVMALRAKFAYWRRLGLCEASILLQFVEIDVVFAGF